MTPLKDRVAVITGGTGGIGLESAKALRENGATVVISDKNVERGKIVSKEFGLEFIAADITKS